MTSKKTPAKLKLTKDTLAKLPVSDQIHWFDEPQNLGVYVGASKRTWKVRLMVLQPDGTKRRKVGSLGSVELVSIDEALRKKLEAELAATKGLDVTEAKTRKELGEVPTLSFLVGWYIREANIVENTRERYLEAKRHLDRILPDVLAIQATKADFLILKDRMKHIKQTFNKLRAVISAAYNYFGDRAIKHAGKVMIPEGFNPIRRVKSYTNRECGTRSSDPYTVEEMLLLIEAAKSYLNPFMRAEAINDRHIPGIATVALIPCLFFTGCRKNELAGVSWEHVAPGKEPYGWTGWVDRAAGLIRLRHTKTGARDVAITPQLDALLSFLTTLHPFWVFPSSRSRSGRVTKMEAAWDRLHEDTGVRRRNPHQTRHSLVTRLIELGEGAGPAGGAVGHLSVRTTEIYIKRTQQASKAALLRGVDSITELGEGWEFLRESA